MRVAFASAKRLNDEYFVPLPMKKRGLREKKKSLSEFTV